MWTTVLLFEGLHLLDSNFTRLRLSLNLFCHSKTRVRDIIKCLNNCLSIWSDFDGAFLNWTNNIRFIRSLMFIFYFPVFMAEQRKKMCEQKYMKEKQWLQVSEKRLYTRKISQMITQAAHPSLAHSSHSIPNPINNGWYSFELRNQINLIIFRQMSIFSPCSDVKQSQNSFEVVPLRNYFLFLKVTELCFKYDSLSGF